MNRVRRVRGVYIQKGCMDGNHNSRIFPAGKINFNTYLGVYILVWNGRQFEYQLLHVLCDVIRDAAVDKLTGSDSVAHRYD
jgi:hypothetical protein